MQRKSISLAAAVAATVMLSLASPALATTPTTSQPTSQPATAELKIVDTKDSFEVVRDYTEWTSYIAHYCGIQPVVLPGKDQKDFLDQLGKYEAYKSCVARWNERWRREHPKTRFGY